MSATRTQSHWTECARNWARSSSASPCFWSHKWTFAEPARPARPSWFSSSPGDWVPPGWAPRKSRWRRTWTPGTLSSPWVLRRSTRRLLCRGSGHTRTPTGRWIRTESTGPPKSRFPARFWKPPGWCKIWRCLPGASFWTLQFSWPNWVSLSLLNSPVRLLWWSSPCSEVLRSQWCSLSFCSRRVSVNLDPYLVSDRLWSSAAPSAWPTGAPSTWWNKGSACRPW